MRPLDPQTAAKLMAGLAEGPEQFVAGLADLFLAIPGIRTMTILAVSPDRTITHRVGTSDPVNFPIGGSDQVGDNPWCNRILGQKLPVVVNNAEQMTVYLPETDDLLALGFGATACVPIVIDRQTRGTINFLGDAEVFTPFTMAAIEALLPFAALIYAFEGIALP